MTRKSRINYLKAISHNVERKKMYKAKKQWIVAGMSFLVATGLGALGSHLTTHADVTQTSTQVQKHPVPNSSASSGSTITRPVQSASTKLGSVQSKATNMYQSIMQNATTGPKSLNIPQQSMSGSNNVNNSTKSKVNQVSVKNSTDSTEATGNISTSGSNQTSAKSEDQALNTKFGTNSNSLSNSNNIPSSAPINQKGSFNSAYQKYMSQIGNIDAKVFKLNNKNKSNRKLMTKALLKDTNYFSGTITKTSTDDGLNYKVWSNGGIEFTDGIANSDLSRFSSDNHDDFYKSHFGDNQDVKNAKSIKFDDNVDMSHVTNMLCMFNNDTNLQSLDLGNNFDTSNVTNMNSMFMLDTNLHSLTLPSSFNISKVTNWFGMLYGDSNLQSLTIQSPKTKLKLSDSDLPAMYKEIGSDDPNGKPYTLSTPNDFSQGNVGTFTTNENPKFTDTVSFHDLYGNVDGKTAPSSITETGGGNGSYTVSAPSGWAIVNSDGTIANGTNNVNNDSKTFNYKDGNQNLNVAPVDDGLTYKYNKNTGSLEFTGGTLTGSLFYNSNFQDWSNINKIDPHVQSIKFDNNINYSTESDMSSMFAMLSNLNIIDFGNNFDTSKVTNMSGMFNSDRALQSLNLGNNFDTSKVTNMSYMFLDDPALQSLDLGNNFDTSKVTNMDSMFSGDNDLQILTIQSPNTRISDRQWSDDLPTMYKKDSNDNYTSPTPNDFSKGNVGTFVKTSNPKPDTIIYYQGNNTNNTVGKSQSMKSNLQSNGAYSDVMINKLTKSIPAGYHLVNSDNSNNGNEFALDGQTYYVQVAPNYDFSSASNTLNAIKSASADETNAIAVNSTVNNVYKNSLKAYNNLSAVNDEINTENGSYGQITSLNTQINLANNLAQSYITDARTDISNSNASATSSALSNAQSANKVASGYATQATRINNAMNSTNPTPSVYNFASATNTINGLSSASADETNADSIHNTMNGYMQSLNADTNSASVSSENTTDSSAYVAISNLNSEMNAANQSASNDIAQVRTDINNSNASATQTDLSNAQADNGKAQTDAKRIIQQANKMTDTNPRASEYGFSSASSVADKLSASANTSTADYIHTIVDSYMSSINADSNSASVSSEVSTDNSNYTQMTNLVSQLNTQNSKVQADIDKVNADAKEPSGQLNASQTINDLNQAQADNGKAQSIVSKINGYASLITDSTTPNVYSFASASSVAAAIKNVSANSKNAYSISSIANQYASSASSLYVNASALNNQSTKDNSAYTLIMNLVNQVSSANSLANRDVSKVISEAKLPMDSRNAANVIAELSNAQSYHNSASDLHAQDLINGFLANMSDQITPINSVSASNEESRANASANSAGSSYNNVEKDNTSAGTLVASASSFESNATKSYDSSAIASLSNLDNIYSNDIKSQSSSAYSASSLASSYAANVKNDYYSYDSYHSASSFADAHASFDSKGAYSENSLANQDNSSAGSYLALMNSISAQMSEDVVLNNDSSEASSASAVTNAASSSASNDSKSASQSNSNAKTENNSISNNSINTSIASQMSSQNSYDQSLSNQIVSDNNLKSAQSIKASSLSVEYKSISNNPKTANNASLKALLSNTASESNSYDAANSVLASDIRIDQSLSNNDTKANSSASAQVSATQASISTQNRSNSSLSIDINNDFNAANNDISSENSIADAMSTDIQNSYATSMSNNNSSDYNITNNASNMSSVDNTANQKALSASQAASMAKDKLADAKSSLAHMTTTNFNELLNAITQASYAKSMADLDYSNASYISYVASSYAKSSGTDLNGNDIQYQESMDNTFWTSLTSNSSYANYYSSLANSVSNRATKDTHAIQSNGANNSINQAYIDQEESVASNDAYLAASYMSNANGDYDLITDRTKPSTKQTVINNDINHIQLDSSSAANFNGGSDTYISGVISHDKQEINSASNSATQDSYVINMSDADKQKSIADSAFANASAEDIGYQDIASDHIDKAIGVGSLHLVYNIHQSDNNGPIVATRTKTIYIPIDKALNISPLTNSSLTISPWTYTKPYYDQHNNNWTISFNSNEFKGFNPNGQYNNLNYNPTNTFTYNATQAGPITVEYKDSDANLGSQTISDIHGLVGQTITLSTPEMGSTDKDIFGELNVPDGYHLAHQLNTITLTNPSSKTINTPPKLGHAPNGMVLTVEIRRNKPTNNSASASVTPASASNVVSNETSNSSQSASVMPMITPTKIDTNTPQSNQSQSNTTSTDTSSNLANALQKQGNSQLQQISSNAHHELKHMMHHNSAKFTPDNDVFYAKIHQLRASRTKLPRVWTVHQLNKVGRGHTVRFGRVIVTSLSGRHSYEFRILKHVYLHKKIYFTHGKFHSLKPSHKALRINRIFLVQQGKHTYIRLELRLNHHTYFITGKKHYVQGLHR